MKPRLSKTILFAFLVSLFAYFWGLAADTSGQRKTGKLECIDAQDVMQNPTNYMGKSITVSGIIDHIEKEATDNRSFLIVLKEGLYCRISKDALENQTGPVTVTTLRVNDIGVYRHFGREHQRILVLGDEIVVYGDLKQEMKKVVLDRTALRRFRAASYIKGSQKN